MMNRTVSWSAVLLCVTLAFFGSSAALANGCIECHESPEFYSKYSKLDRYYKDWQKSPHALAGLTCDDCHGGVPEAERMESAHAGVLPMNDPRSTLYYQNQPETCGGCHASKQAQFVESKHYRALMQQRAAPTCTTCHPAMSKRPEMRKIVLNACRNCHGEGNSENLPLITRRADAAFQQLNIAGGFLGWTKLHYESHDWPGDSKARYRRLERQYRDILNRVHRFDLAETEGTTQDLLGELRDIFEQEKRSRSQSGGSSP